MKPNGNSCWKDNSAASARFDARLDAVPTALDFLAQALGNAGMTPELVSRCELVLEELFRNSVLHGYGGDSAHSIWIGVEAQGTDGTAPCFWYEDEAPPYDPLTADLPDGGAVRPVEEHRVGGVGLLLIRQLPKRVEYVYKNGRNRIVVMP
jgi:anti-sigma regulatory factor (Ser/Thr protein kinase)